MKPESKKYDFQANVISEKVIRSAFSAVVSFAFPSYVTDKDIFPPA